MKLDQLRYFAEVAKCHSIGMAAENLYVTAPAVSISIKSLEKELNCSLFDRNKNDITLTAIGQEILPKVEAMLNMEKEIYQSVDAMNRTVHEKLNGTLKIVSVPIITHSFLQNAVVGFFQKNPTVRIDILDLPAEQILEDIRSGRNDIGFSIMSKEDLQKLLGEDELEAKKLFKEKIFLIAHKRHNLSTRQSIRSEDIRNYPTVSFAHVPLDAFYYPDTVIKEEMRPNVSTRSFEIVRKLVECGDAVAVVTSSMAVAFNSVPDIDVIPISDIDGGYICYCYRKNNENAANIEAFESEVLRNLI